MCIRDRIANRSTGSLVSFETGEAVTYGLFNAQQRGTLLVGAGEKVYEGMVIGYTASGEDVDVNVCKTKHLTNTRASGSDDALRPVSYTHLDVYKRQLFFSARHLQFIASAQIRQT